MVVLYLFFIFEIMGDDADPAVCSADKPDIDIKFFIDPAVCF